MSELTPITRIESYLDAIVNNGIPPTEDIARVETFLQAIYDNQVCALTPITRIEMFLGKISGQSIDLPEPVTRIELYLAAIAGEDVVLPDEPITRIEEYLADWVESGEPEITLTGAIVEFITQRAHKLKSCVVSLSPQQDLHGYDSPWPESGGANKLPPMEVAGQYTDVVITASGETYTLNGNPSAYGQAISSDSFTLPAGTYYFKVFVVSGSGSAYPQIRSVDGSTAYATIHNPSFTLSEATELKARFTWDASLNASNLTVRLMIVTGSTEPTAWSPYENICPISGWNGVTVNRAGKNLLPNEVQSETVSGITCVHNPDGSLTFSGRSNGLVYFILDHNFNSTKLKDCLFYPTFENVIYPLNPSGCSFRICSQNSFAGIQDFSTDSAGDFYSRAIRDEGNNLRFTIRFATGYVVPDGFTVKPMIVLPTETDFTYEPYKGNSYSATFNETVYGATPDIVNGNMLILKAIKSGMTRGGLDSSGKLYQIAELNDARVWALTYEAPPIISTALPTLGLEAARQSTSPCIAQYSTRFYVGGYIGKEAELDALLQSLEFVYELATPVETTIAPTPITTLKGYNVVWSDAGTVEVTAYGTPIAEPDVQPLQAMNLLLGGAYRNNHTPEDVSDEEALNIITGGADR